MKSIRIISPQFDFLGEIDNYESLIFTRKFFKVGEFEMHININKKYTDVLVEDNLIMLGNDTHKVGVIRHREINQENTEDLIIKGYTLKGVVGRRLTVTSTYDRINSDAESVMKHYVDNHCINPTDPKRVIAQLALAQNLNRGINTPWQTRYERLDDVLGQVALYCDIGWEVYLDIDNSKWIFDVNEGRNLTADQELLPPVIFSVDFDNIKNQHYVNSALGYKNCGYAGGKGNEDTRLIQVVGDVQGLERIETFLDCSSSEDVEELIANGQQALKQLDRVLSFESSILNRTFIYEQDWTLGDIVTIQNKKWSLTMNARITEVKEIYEAKGIEIEVTFGNEIPTLVSKVKSLLNNNVR